MTRTRDWLDGYEKAWRTKDADDIRALFTDDAEYWFRPDDREPVRGIDRIIDIWNDEEPAEPEHELEVLVEDADVGIVRGHVEYPGHQRYLNLWEVHFAADGRAHRFVEWFMVPRTRDQPPTDDPAI